MTKLPKYLSDHSRTSIDDKVTVDSKAYNRTIKRLEQFKFWDGCAPILGLWDHQKSSVALGVAYLNADRSLPTDRGLTEAALIKLPTGTGKSGIVAVLSRCIPEAKRVLVLTPRAALSDQLAADIRYRFWSHIGFEIDDEEIWYADAETAGAVIDQAVVKNLLPNANRLTEISKHKDADRLVIVGTLQAFDDIRRARDQYERKQRKGQKLSLDESAYLEIANPFLRFLGEFDLVVVDEGHYEPALSWSRSVRLLNLPTILLSATPFRNDYKLFRVRGRFICNLPYQVAEKDRIVRKVEFVKNELPDGEEDGPKKDMLAEELQDVSFKEEDSVRSIRVTQRDRDDVTRFADHLLEVLPNIIEQAEKYTETPKVIVRGGSFEILMLLQEALFERFGERPVLVHERVKKPTANDKLRLYQSVSKARATFPQARFWLHETKLLEGIDEPDFVAVALYDPFTNARQLVQQIGRAIRSTDKKRSNQQIAFVITPPEFSERTERSWQRFLEFEEYVSNKLSNVVPSEAYLPEEIVKRIPEMQYVDGEFRHRLPDDATVPAEDITLPLRASAFTVQSGFDLDLVSEEIYESILSRNRFVVREIAGLPDFAFGWTYFGVRESPYLVNHFMTEWVMGVFLGAEIDGFFFAHDTDGIVFDAHKIDVQRADRDSLLRVFPEDSDLQSAITRMASHSLDMSDRAIRSISARTRSYAETFTDLLDPVLVPTAVSGFVEGTGRYLGIRTGKISDSSNGRPSLAMYFAWLKDMAGILQNKKIQHSRVFDRYANPADVDDETASKPSNILLDLTQSTFREFGVLGDVDPDAPEEGDIAFDDVCADIDGEGKFNLIALDGTEIKCSIDFLPKTRRYKITSSALNERHPPRVRFRGGRSVSLTEWINREQAFRVTVPVDGVVYMQGQFHQSRDFVGADGTVLPLENVDGIAALRHTVSEKGEDFFDDAKKWRKESIFGVVKAYCDGDEPEGLGSFADLSKDFDLILLDDGGDEIADFIAVGDRSVALIHAKASEKEHTSAITQLQAVGRQAIASLAFCSTQAQVDGIADDRFNRDYIANKKHLELSRIFKNDRNVPEDEIAARVRFALRNPTYAKEIWIMAGRLMDVSTVRSRAEAKDLSNRQRQLLMFIQSLRTSCARANTSLRIFGY